MEINNSKKRIDIDDARKEIESNLKKNPAYSLELAERVIKEYPQNSNVESLFNFLRLKALIGLNRYEEVLNDSKVYISKYIDESPKLACDFEFLKIDAIKGIEKDNGDKAVIEEIERVVDNFPQKHATKLERRRLRVLVSLGMTKNQLNDEILRLSEKYSKSPAAFRNQADLYYTKESSDYKEESEQPNNSQESKDLKQKNKIDVQKFNSILELNDEEFSEYIKQLGQREKEFLLVARYKKQRRNDMADGVVKEYAKRYKEETGSTFLKTLKTLSGMKKGAMDVVKWSKAASDLDLDLEPHIKDTSDIEL